MQPAHRREFARPALPVLVVISLGGMLGALGVTGSRRLVRPFLGVGVLGAYTTFSTYVIDAQQAVDAGAARLALGLPGRHPGRCGGGGVDRLHRDRRGLPPAFPRGSASRLLGLLAGLPATEPMMVAVGVRFCGALTTCSTFGYETLRLVQG